MPVKVLTISGSKKSASKNDALSILFKKTDEGPGESVAIVPLESLPENFNESSFAKSLQNADPQTAVEAKEQAEILLGINI